MATDETIDSEYFILKDNWPASPFQCNGVPCSYNLQGHASHNVATAAYPIGTKFQVYNDGSVAGLAGWSTMIYLQVGTQGTVAAIGAKSICMQGSVSGPYVVTNNFSDATDPNNGLCAIGIGAVTNDYYGWFWCGGVAPEILCDTKLAAASATMGGNYYGKPNLEIGPIYLASASATVLAAKHAARFASLSATTVLAGVDIQIGTCFAAGA